MSLRVKVVLNKDAVRSQLLKSPEMMAVCEERAREIAARCGDGYAVDTHQGKTRVNAMVYADTYEAYRDNLKNNTILKAVKG